MLRPSRLKPPRQRAKRRHALTSPMIVIPRLIGRQAGDRRPDFRPPWSTAVRQLCVCVIFTRPSRPSTRHTKPSLSGRMPYRPQLVKETRRAGTQMVRPPGGSGSPPSPRPPPPFPPPSAFHASVRVFRIPLGRELSGFSRLPAHAAGCGGRVRRGHGVGWGEGGGQARRRRQLNAPVASSRAPTPGAGTITSRAVTASGLSEAAVEFTNPTKKSAPVWKMPLAAIV